jgi:transcription termination factor Rho
LNSLPAVNKTELESKHLSELHALAAEAGVERYRMLPRAELIEKLAGGKTGGEAKQSREPGREPRQRGGREERPGKDRGKEKPRGGGRQRRPRREESNEVGRARKERSGREPEQPRREQEPAVESPRPEPTAAEPAAVARPKRKRRRRRWGRRPKGVRVHDLLLPATPGRQAIVYAETREGCTALLRGVAAELADASDGADPIALLIDPTPEELADWRREAPKAEIVAAGQARHAEDAIAQATLRANGGEDVIVLIDSLSRFVESYGDADGAKNLFDAGRGAAGSGSLTVVAAVERTA